MADDLPQAWPRYLSRSQAAAYVGVSPDTFGLEVEAGWWPAGRRRGPRGGKLTWDRVLLDREADRFAGLDIGRQHLAGEVPGEDPAVDALDRRIDGEAEKHRHQRRQQATA